MDIRKFTGYLNPLTIDEAWHAPIGRHNIPAKGVTIGMYATGAAALGATLAGNPLALATGYLAADSLFSAALTSYHFNTSQ